MVYKFTHYVDFISYELECRAKRNPNYSLRAFSRDLEVSPGFLSKLLKFKVGLSMAKAHSFATLLDLDQDTTNYFCDLVASRHSRSEKMRLEAQERLISKDLFKKSMSTEAQSIMEEWYYVAILELTYLEGFESSCAWISKSLSVDIKIIEAAVKKLFRLNLLNIDNNKWVKSDRFLNTSDEVPSQLIRKLHAQFLEKSISCLDKYSVTERDNTALVLTMSLDSLKKYKLLIREFRERAKKLILQEKNPSEIYCLTTSLFPLKKVIND